MKNRALVVNKHFIVESPEFLFVGIKYHLEKLELKQEITKIVINLSTDGLPLYNSGRGQRFWPFVMQIDGYTDIHVVSIYAGVCDPTADILVHPLLLDELKDLYDNGWNGLAFEIGFITCDLMAMAKLKGIKGPSGYDSCYKCVIKGYYSRAFHKIVFDPTIAESSALRTNASFRDPTVQRCHHQMVNKSKQQIADDPPEEDNHTDEDPIIMTPLISKFL